MPWLETVGECSWIPPWVFEGIYRLTGLRASPRLLVLICSIQLTVLLLGMFQQIDRYDCHVIVPAGGTVVVECDTCTHRTLTLKAALLHLSGASIILCGLGAVFWRNQQLLAIYGMSMLFFSFMVGLVAILTALEGPVLEVAVSSISELDAECIEWGERMLASARDHAFLASLGCLVDTLGAVLAIRSKELFAYEDIAAQHAEVSNAQSL